MSDPVTVNALLFGIMLLCALLMVTILRLFPFRVQIKSRLNRLLATWLAFSLGAKASLAFILATYYLIAEITG